MKPIFMCACLATVLVAGCISQHLKNVALSPQVVPDSAKVETNRGQRLAEITNKAALSDLADFVNSLPPKWEVPWYGPPVGKVYFQFYKQDVPVGNFYVGPNFFARDMNYGDGNFRFFSQDATPAQIERLATITGVDLRPQIDEEKP